MINRYRLLGAVHKRAVFSAVVCMIGLVLLTALPLGAATWLFDASSWRSGKSFWDVDVGIVGGLVSVTVILELGMIIGSLALWIVIMRLLELLVRKVSRDVEPPVANDAR